MYVGNRAQSYLFFSHEYHSCLSTIYLSIFHWYIMEWYIISDKSLTCRDIPAKMICFNFCQPRRIPAVIGPDTLIYFLGGIFFFFLHPASTVISYLQLVHNDWLLLINFQRQFQPFKPHSPRPSPHTPRGKVTPARQVSLLSFLAEQFLVVHHFMKI